MASSVRRALGDRDPNAPLSPVKSASTKTPDLKAVGTRSPNASALRSFDESKKRSLEDAAFPALLDLDASATHATKRSKQETAPEPTTGSPVPQELVAEPSEAQQATPPSTISPTQATDVADSATLARDAASAQEAEESCSQAPTLADSVAETSFAETLRLRLRMAMYKVKTDQVSAPMSRLEIGSPSPSMPKDTLQIKDPPEETMRAYRRRSGSKHRRRSQPSQRHKIAEDSTPLQYAPYDMPLPARLEPEGVLQDGYAQSSSPACSDCEGHDHGDVHDAPATPASITVDRTAFSSPEDYDAPESDQRRPVRVPERDVTSSAVKGNAADSLLRLGESM